MAGITSAGGSDNKVVGQGEKLKKKTKKIVKKFLRIPFIIIYFIPSVLILLTNIRFVINSNPRRVGHLAVEFDCFIKEMLLGIRPRVTAVALHSSQEVANNCLLRYWETRIHIVRNRLLSKLLKPFQYFPYLRITLLETATAVNETADYPSVLARWSSRAPLLKMTESHRARGEECLKELGVPEGSWFVCVHTREGGYSPKDEYINTHRNSDIDDYRLAMGAIVERGGWCLRMGDATMKPLQPMAGVIDYAISSQKSDWMDVFLCAECRFFLGCASGLGMISTVFGVPSAFANLTPLSGAYPCGVFDLGVPMTLRMRSGKVLPFADALRSPVANLRHADLFEANGVTNVANDPEEIKDLAIEMMDRLNNTAIYTDEDEKLQENFRTLFRPGHYTYGAISRVGRDFLRRHSDLI